MKTQENIHALFMPSWYPTKQDPTYGIFVQEQARAVQSIGVDVGVLFLIRSRSPEMKMTWNLDHGINACICRVKFPPKIWFLRSVWLRQYEMAFDTYVNRFGKPNVIHAHSYVGGIAAVHIGEKHDIPVVLTEHSTNLVTGVPFKDRPILRSTYQKVDQLIAVSTFLKEHMSHLCPSKSISVIPNTVNTEIFKPREGEKSGVQILAIGALISRKRFDLLIRAFAIVVKENPAARLIILGEGKERRALQKLAESLNLAGNVSMPGNKSLDQVAKIMSSSSVLVSTSKLETFGVTLIEAIACGIPIVCTENGGSKDIVTPDVGSYFAEATPQSIAKEIMHLLPHSTSKDNVSPDSALTKYNYRTIGSQLKEIYTNVLK